MAVGAVASEVRMKVRWITTAGGLAMGLALAWSQQAPLPPSEEVQGSPMYRLFPRDHIPAIFEPEFVFGEEAEAQMLPDEPVLGVFDGVDARAYSLWQLEHHEVVDDRLGGTPIAATF